MNIRADDLNESKPKKIVRKKQKATRSVQEPVENLPDPREIARTAKKIREEAAAAVYVGDCISDEAWFGQDLGGVASEWLKKENKSVARTTISPAPEYMSTSDNLGGRQRRATDQASFLSRPQVINRRREKRWAMNFGQASAVAGLALAAAWAISTPRDRSGEWEVAAEQAGTALEAGRLAEARVFINQAKQERPDHAWPLILESRLGIAEQNMSLVRRAAKDGLKKSDNWHSDLILARMLARAGDKDGSADAALQSFVKGAGRGYLAEIVEAQIGAGRRIAAQRIMTYALRRYDIKRNGFARTPVQTALATEALKQ